MARPRANLIEDTDPPVEPVTETITYIPGEQDKPQVTWGGHTFQANVPKTITGHAEGSNQERINHHLIESARNNKHFQVGGTKKKRDASALPETAEQYRAYMVDWLQGSFDHADELIQRFARDRDLRDRCDVGSDDYSYLATLFMPRLHELARGDDLNDLQVSTIWAQNGFNVLPW